jgi:3',5'-cyclic AMP phosphodiesterase CpdA
MRLWIMSDLHLELTRGWDLPGVGERPDYDVLVVAGDLTTRMERGVAWLLARVTDKAICGADFLVLAGILCSIHFEFCSGGYFSAVRR